MLPLRKIWEEAENPKKVKRVGVKVITLNLKIVKLKN